MPLKYKMLVFFFSVGIIVIGSVTFSLISPEFPIRVPGSHTGSDTIGSEASGSEAVQATDGTSRRDVLKELDDLVVRYFQAKREVDMEAIAGCVSNVGHVDEKKLLTEATYIEAYRNIQCKVMDGATEDAYRVYVYYDVKIYDIDTLIPSLNALYIKRDPDKGLLVYLGRLSSEEQKYIDRLDDSEVVRALVRSVQNRMRSVVSSDSDVRDFYEMLESAEDEKGDR